MVDYSLFKKILSSDYDSYIQPDDYIDWDTMSLFINSKFDKVSKLFPRTQRVETFNVQLRCSECGKMWDSKLSKNKTFGYINDYHKGYPVLCDDCKEKNRRIKLLSSSFSIDEIIKDTKENTELYIKTYLDPNKAWSNNTKPFEKIRDIRDVRVDWGVISDHIRNMKYREFLETPYWNAVASKVRSNAGYKCQLCNSSDRLNVHHRTYSHHGDEVHHLEDLVCICQKCHSKYHGKGGSNA